MNLEGYKRLSLPAEPAATARAAKGECDLTFEISPSYAEDILAIVLPPRKLEDPAFHDKLRAARRPLSATAAISPAPCCSAATMRARLAYLDNLATQMKVSLVATNDVHYHMPERRALHDVVTAIRLELHRRGAGLPPLRLGRAASQAARGDGSGCSASHPHAIERIAGDRRSLPASPRPAHATSIRSMYEGGETPMQKLERLTWKGAACRYPEGVPEKVARHDPARVRPDRAARRSRPTS